MKPEHSFRKASAFYLVHTIYWLLLVFLQAGRAKTINEIRF
ncbi:MAG: hypothetical protein ACJ75B_22430 [Flavisolibacter sp.]